MQEQYLVISTKVLPDYFLKVAQARKDLENRKYDSISEACEAYGISRSTYYKYKDTVYLFQERKEQRKIVFALTLNHEAGVLSKVCSHLSKMNVSILTISQSIPINGQANVSISANLLDDQVSSQDVMKNMNEIQGVISSKLLSFE